MHATQSPIRVHDLVSEGEVFTANVDSPEQAFDIIMKILRKRDIEMAASIEDKDESKSSNKPALTIKGLNTGEHSKSNEEPSTLEKP
jgi:hypothetical protein